MFVHGPNLARPHSNRSLQFRAAIDETGNRLSERRSRSRAVSLAAVRNQLIKCCTTIWNDQWEAAGARLGSNQTEGFGFAAVHQRIGARQQLCEFVPIRDPRKDSNTCQTIGKALKSPALRSVTNQKQSDGVIARALRNGTHHHIPTFLGRESTNAEQQGSVSIETKRRKRPFTQCVGAERRRECSTVDTHAHRFAVRYSAVTQPLGQMSVGADDSVKHSAKAA